MKNWKALILAVGFAGLLAWQTHEQKQQEKKYTVTLPLNVWIKYSNGLEQTAQSLRQSDRPSREVAYLTDSVISPIWVAINEQVGQQQQAESKKDSTNKK